MILRVRATMRMIFRSQAHKNLPKCMVANLSTLKDYRSLLQRHEPELTPMGLDKILDTIASLPSEDK